MSGLVQLKNLKEIQIRREKMSKNYFNLVSNYKKKLSTYMPPKNIKSAWYRFYFFLNPNIKNLQSIRFNIIKNLKKKELNVLQALALKYI